MELSKTKNKKQKNPVVLRREEINVGQKLPEISKPRNWMGKDERFVKPEKKGGKSLSNNKQSINRNQPQCMPNELLTFFLFHRNF